MASLESRLPENVPGRFYVGNECIDCDMCRETAPTIYRRNDAIGYSVVYHQPETEAERQLAQEGMEGCPADAIANDGVAA